MEFIKFKSDDVAPVMERIASVISQKNIIPALLNVSISTRWDGNNNPYLELLSSDGEMWLRMYAPCDDATREITIYVDAKEFAQSLKSLSGKSVTMEIDEEKHIVVCSYGNGRFKLPMVSSLEYPMPKIWIEDMDNLLVVDIPSSRLLSAIRSVFFATANDEIRLILNGVHFDFLEDGMVSVGTNGQCLVKYKDLSIKNGEYPRPDAITNDVSKPYSLTMSKKVCETLMRVLPNITSDVHFAFDESGLVIRCDAFEVYARPIDGKYPNYDSVIPRDNNDECHTNKNNIVSAIKHVIPFGNNTNAFIAITFKENLAVVAAENIDFNKEASEDVDARTSFLGREQTIGFNGNFLSQLIQNVDGENVKFLIGDERHAMIVTNDSDIEDVEYTSILMPILLKNR